jgi:hyperosmotically inducible protein
MQRRLQRIETAALAVGLCLLLAGAASAAQPPDAGVATQAKISLLTTDGAAAIGVHVDTVNGRVTLHGTVPTEADKTRAEQAVAKVDGVTKVRNLLRVVAPKREKQANAGNSEVRDRVKKALAADPALGDSSITVQSVNAGVAVLGGTAQTLSDAHRAIDVVITVPGVRRVASEIESPDTLGDDELWRDGPYDPAEHERSAARDTWTTTAAKVRLIANTNTPGFDINLDTRNGIVTLFGVVASEDSKQAAEAELRKVDGVKDVVNDLQVVAAVTQDRVDRKDEQITHAIQSRFDGYQGLANSEIEVINGVARLSGTVKSRSDQVTAITIARDTNGVVRVIDDAKLEPPTLSAR